MGYNLSSAEVRKLLSGGDRGGQGQLLDVQRRSEELRRTLMVRMAWVERVVAGREGDKSAVRSCEGEARDCMASLPLPSARLDWRAAETASTLDQ